MVSVIFSELTNSDLTFGDLQGRIGLYRPTVGGIGAIKGQRAIYRDRLEKYTGRSSEYTSPQFDKIDPIINASYAGCA